VYLGTYPKRGALQFDAKNSGPVKPDFRSRRASTKLGEGKQQRGDVFFGSSSLPVSANQPFSHLVHAAESHTVRHDHSKDTAQQSRRQVPRQEGVALDFAGFIPHHEA